MRATLATLFWALTLSGCSLIFPDDPREGEENADDCAERLANWDAIPKVGRTDEAAIYVPTYTYDVTKMGLEEVQALIVPGSDETAGARDMAATNEISTAVENFMQQPVDEDGAFFLGRDPALYRVLGEGLPKTEILAAGCARQQSGMRLIAISLAEPPSLDAEEPDSTDTADETSN